MSMSEQRSTSTASQVGFCRRWQQLAPRPHTVDYSAGRSGENAATAAGMYATPTGTRACWNALRPGDKSCGGGAYRPGRESPYQQWSSSQRQATCNFEESKGSGTHSPAVLEQATAGVAQVILRALHVALQRIKRDLQDISFRV